MLTRVEYAIYVIAVVVFVITAWRRIGEWDRSHDELEQRRHRSP